jgi:phosphomannomutase
VACDGQAFNLPPFIPVEEQIAPHPDFPTVAFPNPEEGKGALKLAIQRADAVGSPLILANDPDADRLAVAEKMEEYRPPLRLTFLAGVLNGGVVCGGACAYRTIRATQWKLEGVHR